MSRGLAVLGSTGSIGTNTLRIVRAFPNNFHVISLVAGKNIERLREQIKEFKPKFVSVQDLEHQRILKAEFPDIDVAWGVSATELAIKRDDVDTVVVGIVGFAAMSPTLVAIEAQKRIALANKEVLVVAGSLLKKAAAKSSSVVIPVDSEHNGLFQLLRNVNREEVASLVITASGGPLLRRPDVPLDDVTPAMAIKHPNWAMGPKISVDSATLMNKGLELIEAHFLFDTPSENLEVWVHPQSLVHAALWMKDNSCMAQLTVPDMRSSIGYALAFPERLPNTVPKISFEQMEKLEFFPPDTKRFPCLELARNALTAGGSHLVFLNAVNEIAVESFLTGELLFSQIPRVIDEVLSRHQGQRLESIEQIYDLDGEARKLAGQEIKRIRR